MEFGWVARASWIVALAVVLGAVLYAKRKRTPGS